MRVTLVAALLAGFIGPLSGLDAQERTAADILREMRDALGGAAALDGIASLSMTAASRMTMRSMSVDATDDYFLLLPDNYVRARRLSLGVQSSAAFDGFRGSELIRVLPVKLTRPIPPEADARALAKLRHDAARWLLALTGRTLPGYPLELAAAGIENVAGSDYDIIEARGPAGVTMRLYVEQKSHLPAMVATTGLEAIPELRWLLSKFKTTDGLMWPRQIEEQLPGGLEESLNVKAWRVNPKISPKTFQPASR